MKALRVVLSLVATVAIVWGPSLVLQADVVRSGGVAATVGGGGGGGTTLPYTDSTTLVCDNTTPTKCARLEASGITAASTRVMTLPDRDGTIFNSGGPIDFNVNSSTTGNITNSLGGAKITFINTGGMTVQAVSSPFKIVTTFGGDTDRLLVNPIPKTLTESSATGFVRVSVASGAIAGGAFEYNIYALDATDQQVRHGAIRFSVANKAGTETCTLQNATGAADTSITETEDGNIATITVGTLTYAITCDTTPANAVDFAINAVSSLTQTTLGVQYQIRSNSSGASTITPL